MGMALTRTEERTVEEKSRVEETIYRRVEKRIELKSRSDERPRAEKGRVEKIPAALPCCHALQNPDLVQIS